DYVALGHIHKHQALNEQPPVVYSGSIERIDFGEAHEPKGFVLAEIDDGPARWEFVETPTRAFKEIVIDVQAESDPMPAICKRLQAEDVEDAVVKVVVKATIDNEPHLDIQEIRRQLKDAAHVAAIVRDVERPTRLRLGTAQEIAEAGPRELLERYFEAKQVPTERRELLLKFADTIFEEEE
ncbi:MAG: metallophosphoesterase family protein, partial [Ardenticatenaceae bacterium]